MISPRSIWLVSNKSFYNSSKTNSLFYRGFNKDLMFGYKFKDDFIGYKINLKNEVFTISNDSLAMLPIYYFFQNGTWACSNNLWELCKLESFNINWDWFRKNSFYYNTPKEGETFVKNINLLKIGNFIKCDSQKLQINNKKHVIFQNSFSKKKSNEKDIIDNIIFNLDNFFDQWKGVSNLYVGNSGGFDSRLMRSFLNRHSIKHNSYTVLRVKSNNFIKTTTEWCAQKSDDLYGKSKYYYRSINLDELEDVLWNPLGSAESSKVPKSLFEEINKIKNPYVFCGGNGYLINYNSTVWGNLNSCRFQDVPKVFLKGFSYENIYGNSKNRLDLYGKSNIKKDIIDVKESLSNSYSLKGLEIVRYLQSRLLNVYSPGGGYESLIYSGFPVYMYYPSLTNLVTRIDDKVLNSRDLLEKVILKVDSRLNFRGQNGQRPLKKNNLKSRIWTKIRGTGIQNIHVRDQEIYNFINSSLNAEFLKELNLLFPVKNSLDFYAKLRKFDKIINKLRDENIY